MFLDSTTLLRHHLSVCFGSLSVDLALCHRLLTATNYSDFNTSLVSVFCFHHSWPGFRTCFDSKNYLQLQLSVRLGSITDAFVLVLLNTFRCFVGFFTDATTKTPCPRDKNADGKASKTSASCCRDASCRTSMTPLRLQFYWRVFPQVSQFTMMVPRACVIRVTTNQHCRQQQ